MSHPDEHFKTEPERARPEEVSRLRDVLASGFAGWRGRISCPRPPGGPRGQMVAWGSGAASRLIPLAVTVAMALSLVVVSAAPAFPAVGGYGNSGQGKPKPHQALARLVLSPAAASIRAGGSVAYAAEGYDAAGHDLGDVTAYTRFSISPDGSCVGATCTASDRGRHTVTGTVDRGNRVISGRAALQVVIPPVPAKPSHRQGRPSHSAARPPGSVHPRGGLVEPSRRVQPRRGPVQAPRRHAGRPRPAARLVLSPARTFILPGERVTYTAEAYDAAGHDLGDVTAKTTFSITFSAGRSFKARPDGSCAGATCTAIKLGRHTVTGTAVLGNGSISGTAALQVVPRHRQAGLLQRLASVELFPKSAVIESGAAISYIAYGYDADHHLLGDVTASTDFSISPDGSCTGATCTATAMQPRMHTVTGTVRLKNRQVTGTAALLVVPRLAGLDVEPPKAVVEVRHSVSYTAYGVDANGVRVVDLTAYTQFSMSQPGSCTGATCTPTEAGAYVVTGNVNLGDRTISGKARLRVIPAITGLRLHPESATLTAGGKVVYDAKGLDEAGRPVIDLTADTLFSISTPGSCTAATCTATKAQGYKVTGTVQLADRTISGTAILAVVPGPLATLAFDPPQATITAGGSQAFRVYGSDAYGNRLGEVTAKTTFTISPDGSCTAATCTATRLGPHTVTGTAEVGNRVVTGSAHLLEVSEAIVSLRLNPRSAVIHAGGKVTFTATGLDSAHRAVIDLTDYTSFSITNEGSCTAVTCTASKLGKHIVTGTVSFLNRIISQKVILQILPRHHHALRPLRLASLELNPKSAVADADVPITYIAIGVDVNGTRLGDLTAHTHFSISPDGSCTHATCTAARPGPHTITGTVNPGTRLIAFTADTGSVNSRNRSLTGTATLQVTATSPTCMPSASDVRSLRVTPGKGTPGTSVRIEGKLDPRFADCPLVLLLGGARFGADTTVGPDGSVSGRRTISSHANRGTSTVTLATIDGRTLAKTSFEILPGPKSGWLLWLLFAIVVLLLAALGAVAIGSERARRQRRWVRQHVRAEPHSNPGQVRTDPDRDAPPTFTIRLQPHADTGTTEITKEGN
jgi:hypothetical protein